MKSELKPGERGFSIILLLVAIVLSIESIKMFMKDPTAASFGALPLFLSLSIVILMLKIIFIENRKQKSEEKVENMLLKVKRSLKYVLTKDMLIIFLIIIAYCLALLNGLGFEISTTLFLFISMSYLIGNQYLKNLLYTAVSMAFILIVFRIIFQVVLP